MGVLVIGLLPVFCTASLSLKIGPSPWTCQHQSSAPRLLESADGEGWHGWRDGQSPFSPALADPAHTCDGVCAHGRSSGRVRRAAAAQET
jgi:hypothetical protein